MYLFEWMELSEGGLTNCTLHGVETFSDLFIQSTSAGQVCVFNTYFPKPASSNMIGRNKKSD
jgi:hypothetical protein